MVNLKGVLELIGFREVTSVTRKLHAFVTAKCLKYRELWRKLQSYNNFWKLSNLKNKMYLDIHRIFLHLELPNNSVTCNKNYLTTAISIT